jgi:hypothetical protein
VRLISQLNLISCVVQERLPHFQLIPVPALNSELSTSELIHDPDIVALLQHAKPARSANGMASTVHKKLSLAPPNAGPVNQHPYQRLHSGFCANTIPAFFATSKPFLAVFSCFNFELDICDRSIIHDERMDILSIRTPESY